MTNKEQARRLAQQIADTSPDGDWYLLPRNATKVVGYIYEPSIGDVAYKGQYMNLQAVIEEAIYQALCAQSEEPSH